MEVEDMHQGTCIACLYEEELDSEGLCAGCAPSDPQFRITLLDVLQGSQ